LKNLSSTPPLANLGSLIANKNSKFANLSMWQIKKIQGFLLRTSKGSVHPCPINQLWLGNQDVAWKSGSGLEINLFGLTYSDEVSGTNDVSSGT